MKKKKVRFALVPTSLGGLCLASSSPFLMRHPRQKLRLGPGPVNKRKTRHFYFHLTSPSVPESGNSDHQRCRYTRLILCSDCDDAL